MDSGGNASERILIKEALATEIGKERLRRYVKSYMRSQSISDAYERELVAAGMSAFEHAFRLYLAKGHYLTSNEDHFAHYFVWWARQYAERYWQNNKTINQ
jgi:hypothetical protein